MWQVQVGQTARDKFSKQTLIKMFRQKAQTNCNENSAGRQWQLPVVCVHPGKQIKS